MDYWIRTVKWNHIMLTSWSSATASDFFSHIFSRCCCRFKLSSFFFSITFWASSFRAVFLSSVKWKKVTWKPNPEWETNVRMGNWKTSVQAFYLKVHFTIQRWFWYEKLPLKDLQTRCMRSRRGGYGCELVLRDVLCSHRRAGGKKAKYSPAYR